MMVHLRKTLPAAIILLPVILPVCFGSTIYPNDDCCTRGTTNYNHTHPFGLLVKNSSDAGWIEFTLGGSPASQATLTIYQGWSVQNAWNIVVKGAAYGFNETTFTGTNTSGWTTVGTIPVQAQAFYSLDVTSFYNSHLGQTVSLQLGRASQPGGDGPIFEDREGTLTGNGATYGPQLRVTASTRAGNPNPPDGAAPVHPDPVLAWTPGDGALSHDVYFGADEPPVFQRNQAGTAFDPGLLAYRTTYYWRVDEVTAGGPVAGDLWRFTTAMEGDLEPDGDVDFRDLRVFSADWPGTDCSGANHWCEHRDINFSTAVDKADFALLAANWLNGVPRPPQPASNPDPADDAADVLIITDLTWTAGEGAQSHDVHFGTTDPPPLRGNQTATRFDPGVLERETTYYWRIDEKNAVGTTPGVVWRFTTGSTPGPQDVIFPGISWKSVAPAELGLDAAKLDQFAANVGGVGCIIRQGYVVKTWGSQSAKADWASAAKPVVSTMLFFAVNEGLLAGVHERIEDHGRDLIAKDEPMEFYHLANMTSGYARGEAPGAAWAYNDYAISLYARTLFDNVYETTANTAATDSRRLGALQLQDGSIFSSRSGYGVSTSVRDFARIGWLWCNYGYWNGTQVLPRRYFEDYMKAHVPAALPRSTVAGSDYLGVGTYGGGSDQTPDGPGVYGFNWWCNPNRSNWPDAPADTVQANGHWGKEVVTVIPSLSLVVACRGDMGTHATGSASSAMNQNLKLLVDACPPFPLGRIKIDPDNPARMVYHATFQDGREKPVCFAGPGDPEDFFYNNTAQNLDLLTSRGARCTYITAVLQDFGGGSPGSGAALDAKLAEWEGYITALENAGVITVFFFFDDSQALPANWQELIDKCVDTFKHHRLLIWSVAEEYQEALSVAQVSQIAARIKQRDDHHHVVGVHQLSGNSFHFANDPNLDMFLMQLNSTSPANLHNLVKTSNANGLKILNMSEAADHAKQTRQNVRLLNWAAVMGGASAVQVLWMGRASDPADWNDPGKYADCARLTDFMESTRLNETVNRDDLARGNTDYVLANPGYVYIAYGDAGTSLGVSVAAGTYRVLWFDPVDGDRVDEGSRICPTGDQTFAKPAAIGAEAALYLQVESPQ